MPRFTVSRSGFPLTLPGERLGTIAAVDREAAQKAADALYSGSAVVVQLEGTEIEARRPVSSTRGQVMSPRKKTPGLPF